jgi:hypothetical protein
MEVQTPKVEVKVEELEIPTEQIPVEIQVNAAVDIQLDEYDDLDEVPNEPLDFRDSFDKYFNEGDNPTETWMEL